MVGGAEAVPEEHTKLKDEGNQHFKAGRYADAIASYTQALSTGSHGDGALSADFQGTVHSNKAACYLKLSKPLEAYTEASQGNQLLDIDTNVFLFSYTSSNSNTMVLITRSLLSIT